MNKKESNKGSLKISVYTVAYRNASDCKLVLGEMHSQTIREDIEMIVVSPNREGISSKDYPEFAAWQWIIVPEIRTNGEAMELAIRAANAPNVVYVEEHSYYDNQWAEKITEAHELGYEIVGFAVENANPETLASWAQIYGQFGPIVAPVESGEKDFLAGHHVSYRRKSLLSYGSSLTQMMEDEGALFLDWRAKGKKLYISGEAVSRHVNISKLWAYIMGDYYGQRSFASTRAKVGNWGFWKRAVFIGATPIIPFVRLKRILDNIYRTGRQRKFLPKILTNIFPALLAGAWGEMLGYLIGPGNSTSQKVPAELNRAEYLTEADKELLKTD